MKSTSGFYLVVTGTPSSVHHYGYLDGFTKNYRYPYEFRISGATPSGYEPGYQKPARRTARSRTRNSPSPCEPSVTNRNIGAHFPMACGQLWR
ncbi:DUF6055 domain-containing protein [Streptomyces diastatochromogenes]|uniref:DUF6055 domain-containing protein n=1 Tax=Streptomyces diastatochromogenes TaxID=42236 RepID=UPI0036B4A18B